MAENTLYFSAASVIDIKREVVQFWVVLWITELDQQIEDDGLFWKLNNCIMITLCLSDFTGSHIDLHFYLVQSEDDTIARSDSDIGIIETD